MRTSSYDNRLLRLLGISAALLFVSVSGHAQTTVAQIATRVKQVDRFVKTKPKARFFGDMSSATEDEKAKWQEFKSAKAREDAGNGDNLSQSAEVWTKQGKVVRVDFVFTSPSGDWAHLITYYFREDGTLAKLEAQHNTFYGDVSVVRIQYFDAGGKQIHATKKILDLQTQKPKKPGEFYDNPVTVFLRTSDLPFHTLL
jgi:hypothetical protein